MEFLSEYGLFLAQAVTVVAAVGAIVLLIAAVSQRQRGEGDGHIEIKRLNDRYDDLKDALRDATMEPEMLKEKRKADKKSDKKMHKEKAKAAKKQVKEAKDGDEYNEEKPKLFVLDFVGDIRASEVERLREEVSVLLSEVGETDEVLLRLESPGGVVYGYGLAASQLQRIRDAGCHLTVAVDKVAASGGYMMACVAEKIIAAPFAVIGSIGVVAQIPNFHRLLKKNDIDFELITAGQHKRTLTLFGENTDEGRAKFVEDIEDTHELFKDFVKEHRDAVDIHKVATGEVWFGQRAVDVNLVDQLQTSDDYIQQKLKSHGVFSLRYVPRKNWQQKLGIAAENALERVVLKLWQSATSRPNH
ncbi:MAG: protease SohB [Pseudomonadota bacterium]